MFKRSLKMHPVQKKTCALLNFITCIFFNILLTAVFFFFNMYQHIFNV